MTNIQIAYYPKVKSFKLQELADILNRNGHSFSNETIRKKLKNDVDNGKLMKLGRNCYCVNKKDMCQYVPSYSKKAINVVNDIKNNYPDLDFSVFELIQLNEFVNHQIAHNVIFVAVEKEVENYIFDTLRNIYPGKVLIRPTLEQYHQYWVDDMIVIIRLISQRPIIKSKSWQARIETILVDLFSDSLLRENISESEYSNIIENVFRHYIVDENSLFRYATRRNADKKIIKIIKDKTNIVLRTKK